MTSAVGVAMLLVTSALGLIQGQPLDCGPYCSCYHGNWTLAVECVDVDMDVDVDVMWDKLPHLETRASFTNQRRFAFHSFPAIWRNLTTQLRIQSKMYFVY